MNNSSDIPTTLAVVSLAAEKDLGLNITTGFPQIIDFSKNDTNITKSGNKIFLPCNNPENIIDEATAEQVENFIHLIVLPLMEIFGVTTNVINCIVFHRQGLKDRINLCLFSLAVADISFLLLVFASRFYSFLGLIDGDLEEYWGSKYLGTVLGPMFGAMTVSNMMTMIISLERCICVLAPFKARKFLKTRYMLVLIITLALYITGMYSLLNMKYVTVRVTDPVTQASHWVTRLGSFYLRHRLVVDILYNHLLLLAATCLSLVVVVAATSLTVYSLRRRLAWRLQMDTQGVKRELAVTKMLMVICLMYVLTMTPSVIQRFFRTLVPGYLPSGKYCNTFAVIQTLVHVCEVVNSSLNFVVYITMGSKFRSTLQQLIPIPALGNKPSLTKSAPAASQTLDSNQ